MKNLLISTLLSFSMNLGAQQIITGTVKDPSGNPLIAANIFFEGSYDGTISDKEGKFILEITQAGKQTLVVSYIGFQTFSREIDMDQPPSDIEIILQVQAGELNEVSIVAGSFIAGDKKKSATMSAFDIATTPSAMGDIYGAYGTMPGSQKVGEEGLLFVRGGDASETRTFMDGMLVANPYFSRIADIPSRGRYSPLLFSETMFSTGGYSAEFGQALSSVVDLTTNGLESSDKKSISIMSVGLNASVTKSMKNSSLSFSSMYANSYIQNRLFKSRAEWINDPVLADASLMYRRKFGESGLLRFFLSTNYNTLEMYQFSIEDDRKDKIGMENYNLYVNLSYCDRLNEKWLFKTGVSGGFDANNLNYNEIPVDTKNFTGQYKLGMTWIPAEKLKIRFGTDIMLENYRQDIGMQESVQFRLQDSEPSSFAESELRINHLIALRAGVRTEYSNLLCETMILPRFSGAMKLNENSQVSLAWGKYSQKPGNDYLKFAPWLTSEKSEHYILNYQYKKDKRMFRAEAYVKNYGELVKYLDPYLPDPANYDNSGYGNAKGFDLFWRDQKSFDGTDYWISYSFLDTRRMYRDYPVEAMPSFASRHNLSIVCKRYFESIRTFVSINYSFASGRPYNDKNSVVFMDGRTPVYNDISMNITWLTSLFDKETVIHLGINNIAGFKNVFGYRFSNTAGEDGRFASQAVRPFTGRQAVLLLLLSL